MEARSGMIQSAAVNGFVTGKNGEKITAEEESTGSEGGEIAKDDGEDKGSRSNAGKGETGGKGGKSRAARRAEKRKLRREEIPHA